MILQYTPEAAFYLAAATIVCFLAWYVWKRRAEPGGFYFSMLMLAGAAWALAIALELMAATPGVKYVCHVFLYLGYMSVPPLWLLFTLEYGNLSRWLTYGRRMAVWVVPALMVVLVATNPWHGLVWPAVTEIRGLSGTELAYQMGPADWIILGYSSLLTLIGTGIIIARALRSSRSNRGRAAVLVMGALIPLAWGIAYVFISNEHPDLDLTPVAFALTGICFAWGIFGQGLFDLKPVARKALIASMADGVLVLDARRKVLVLNPAARQMLGAGGQVLGQSVETLQIWPTLEPYCQDYGEKAAEITLRDGETCLDTSISPLPDRFGKPAGLLITLRDTTERKKAERALRQAYGEMTGSNLALRAEVVDRQKAEAQSLAALREKEVLLKEVHQRVKNNLQIISSLLSLQAGKMGGPNAAAFSESQNRIKSMALIHEQLYQATDLARVDFAGYIQSLATHLARSYVTSPVVRIELDIEEISLDLDTAMPCGLIVNELVSNSLKYAFPEGRPGTVSVALRRAGGAYRLTVADDGVGMPPAVDFRDSPSLGLQLVNVLVGQLEGTIELDSARGTRFTVTFGGERGTGAAPEAGRPGR